MIVVATSVSMILEAPTLVSTRSPLMERAPAIEGVDAIVIDPRKTRP